MPLNANPSVKLATTPVKEAEVNSTHAPRSQPSNGNMLESIAKYRGYGQALRQTASMREIATKLSEIAEMAENAVVNEADDWFDQHTVKRNMKEIKGYSGDFAKLANEADLMNQRMAALYEDMGRVLERYFDLGDDEDIGDGDSEFDTPDDEENNGELSTAIQAAQQNDREVPDHNPDSARRLPESKEVEAGDSKDGVPIESPYPNKKITAKSGKVIIDELTLKAIKSVHGRLKREGKMEYANRFAKLPPKKMKEAVWKILR